jgi:hypothetical protein
MRRFSTVEAVEANARRFATWIGFRRGEVELQVVSCPNLALNIVF